MNTESIKHIDKILRAMHDFMEEYGTGTPKWGPSEDDFINHGYWLGYEDAITDLFRLTYDKQVDTYGTRPPILVD